MQNYLTPEELAQQLRVDVTEIMALIEQGRLGAIRIGNNIRIPESALEKLLVTSAAGPTPKDVSDSPVTVTDEGNTRLVPTRTGRASFRVSGSIAEGAEIWPGKMPYPIRFPKAFMDALLAHFPAGEVAVGGSFDGSVPNSLGEFIQEKLKTKMNPAVYVAALLIDEGYADDSRRGYIRFRSEDSRTRKMSEPIRSVGNVNDAVTFSNFPLGHKRPRVNANDGRNIAVAPAGLAAV
jgi:excisionase family DNA binding protein